MRTLMIPAPDWSLVSRRRLLVGGLALAGWCRPGATVASSLDELWRCGTSDCPGYTYDPRRGDDVFGILAGTPFQQLPEDWVCPRCGSSKDGFYLLGQR